MSDTPNRTGYQDRAKVGFTLAEVAELLENKSHHHGRRAEPGLQARAAAKLAEVEQEITDLTVIRDTSRKAVDAGVR